MRVMQRTPEEGKKRRIGNGTEDIEIRDRRGPLHAGSIRWRTSKGTDLERGWPEGGEQCADVWTTPILCCGYNQAHCEENLSTVE